MSFPRYERYKDSGVEWLGEVPVGWLCSPVKNFGKLKGGAGFPHGEQGVEYEELSFHKVNALAQANQEGELLPSENTISRSTASRLSAYIFPKGSIVFAKVGAALLLARIRCLKAEACIDNNMMGLVVNQDGYASRFVMYSLQLVRFDLIANPGAVPSLNESQIGNFVLAAPPLPEQQAIAAFLDRETAKIDELINEQTNLIRLLKEKRQAVISHAVTKGLDPNVPMKDSGVEWLGEVPVGWEVTTLKRKTLFITSGSRGWAEHYSDEGTLFIRIGNLTRKSIDLDLSDVQRVSPPSGSEGERTRVRSGDILFSITAFLGSVAVVPDSLETAYVSQHVALVRLRDQQVMPRWIGYVAFSIFGKTHFDTAGYGGTKIQLSLKDVEDMPSLFPPLPEQQAIVDFLDRETAKLDELTAEAERSIELLKERRSALISAAVTGKIDVRNYAWEAA